MSLIMSSLIFNVFIFFVFFFVFYFLKKLLMLQCCIGIIGGKPKHSLFFVGFQGMLGDIMAHLSGRFYHKKNTLFFSPSPSIAALIKMTSCCT